MRRLGTMLGFMAVMIIGLIPLGTSGADTFTTTPLPVWDFQGVWTGKANIMTENLGYLENVDAQLVVPQGSETVAQATGMAYFKASLTFAAPFGTGNPVNLIAAVKTKAPERWTQGVMVMWSADGVMGCSMGTQVSVSKLDSNADPNNDPMLLHGCMHFTGGDTLTKGGQAPITDAPAMAIVDLMKQ